MALTRLAAAMATRSLRHIVPPLPFEPPVLAHCDAGGHVAWEGPSFAPAGPLLVAVWTPDARPAIRLVHGRLWREGATWRFHPAAPGWWVAWVHGAPPQPS